jgi:nitrous oxidase accessory protein NosD
MQGMFRIATKTIGLLVLVFCAANEESAATLTVGKNANSCPNAKYTTIGAAVTAAQAGDELEICPAVYPEQLVITKPLTLRGIASNGFNRVVLQPGLVSLDGVPFQAVITVMNTQDVTIQNLTIEASNNTVSGCTVGRAGVHFYDASGTVDRSTIVGAKLQDPRTCTTLMPGNGIGIHVNTDGTNPGPFRVYLSRNSIHDFNRNGILVAGSGATAEIDSNQISGTGPSLGILQFGIFVSSGAVGLITRNSINQGLCGTLSVADCTAVRSEGIVLRSAGDGTLLDRNMITNVQSGIFVNGGNSARITNNIIRNVDALSGIDVQGTASGFFSNSLIEGNTISHVGPVDENASMNFDGCGISEYPGTGVSGNIIRDNVVYDAYCGVAHVAADFVGGGGYFNTLYTVFNSDLYLDGYPPAKLP